jgi:hypothetical protein
MGFNLLFSFERLYLCAMQNEPKLNYIPGSMSFADGFMGMRGDVGYTMVYNSEKATAIINNLLKDGRDVVDATVGLDGDFSINSGVIYEAGEWSDYEEYNNSRWATPIMIVTFTDGPSECYEVWEKQ